MPYVEVKLIGELSKEQKAKIAEDITETLFKVAGKSKDHTYVVFQEVKREDWAAGGVLFADKK